MAKNCLFQQSVGDTLLLSDRQQISRDIPIVNSRNLKIISRYYVYTVLMNVPIEQAVIELKREFFLKEKVIKKIVDSRQPEFDEMCKEQRQLDWFKTSESFSHINWDYNPLSPSNPE